jgi:integrase
VQPVRRTTQRAPQLEVSGLYSETRNHELWDGLPEIARNRYFTRRSMPPEYLEAILENRPAARVHYKGVAISFRGLPEPMARELAWCLNRHVKVGRTVHAEKWNQLTAILERVCLTDPSIESLVQRTEAEWTLSFHAHYADQGAIAPAKVDHRLELLRKLLDHLVVVYHDGDWWELDVWNPICDPRIPQRDHEPSGRNVANFSDLTAPWLRAGAKFWLKTYLETGAYTWSSVKSRLDSLKWLQRHIDELGAVGPQIRDDPDAIRPWFSAFVKFMRKHRVLVGPTKGQLMGAHQLRSSMSVIETFYRFMFDSRVEAAALLGDQRWLKVGLHHCVLFRPDEKPRYTNRAKTDRVLSDEVVQQIAEGSSLLGLPREEGGMADEQALRALLLLMRTGRRVNEVLMLDFDPLETLQRPLGDADTGFVARLRYQQTKVLTSDPSILVDAEVVALVKAQQVWCHEHLRSLGNAEPSPKYLFVKTTQNRLGLHPYAHPTLQLRLLKLTRRLDIRDTNGLPVQISHTHTFRHTKATNLLNAGVPLHVVMRFLGHQSVNMTAYYAKTLERTAEREFLRYKKITADGKLLDVDPRDLYDMLELDQRADRILPNGVCLLPPRQVCAKGNACLTCTDFVTDGSFSSELEEQLVRTEALIEQRQAAFEARHGQRMEEGNIWLAGRLREVTALRQIMATIDVVEPTSAVRGAGTSTGRKPTG